MSLDISKAICAAYKSSIRDKETDDRGRIRREPTSEARKATRDIQRAFFDEVLDTDFDQIIKETKKANDNESFDKEIPDELLNQYVRKIT